MRTTNRIQSFSLVVDVLHDVQVLREVEGVLHANTSKRNRSNVVIKSCIGEVTSCDVRVEPRAGSGRVRRN